MKIMYWPAGGEPVAIRRAKGGKDLTHPVSGNQVPAGYFAAMSDADLNADEIYRIAEVKPVLAEGQKYGSPVYVEATHTLDYPVIDIDIEVLKRGRLAELAGHYRSVLYGGLIVLAKNMPTDTEALTKINSIGTALAAGNAYPVGGIKFFTIENDRVSVNEANFGVLTEAVAVHSISSANAYDTHEIAIQALATAQAVIDYDITTGFPANPIIEEEL